MASNPLGVPPSVNADLTPLYQPRNPQESATFRFLATVNRTFHLSLTSYHDLWVWSTSHIDDFWGAVWDETGIIGHKGAHVVDNSALPPENPPWFTEADLNWAENMLQCRSSEKVALIQASGFTNSCFDSNDFNYEFLRPAEPTSEILDPPLVQCTYSELYLLVADLVSALLVHDLKPGDRVASYSSNCIVRFYIKEYTMSAEPVIQIWHHLFLHAKMLYRHVRGITTLI